ncbi:MAG: DUF192 domain-containing protein [Planctomycetota bacterium]
MQRLSVIAPAAVVVAAGLGLLTTSGCSGCSATENGGRSPDSAQSAPARTSDLVRKYPLDSLPTGTLTANGHSFRVWLARDNDRDRPEVVQEGLMHVPSSEIGDGQGMLFIFDDEQVRGFWMKNTIAPLDIAFARMNGTIVRIRQMPPLTLQTFSSLEPAMFALEVKQGTFGRLGIQEGDRLVIPPEVSRLPG